MKTVSLRSQRSIRAAMGLRSMRVVDRDECNPFMNSAARKVPLIFFAVLGIVFLYGMLLMYAVGSLKESPRVKCSNSTVDSILIYFSNEASPSSTASLLSTKIPHSSSCVPSCFDHCSGLPRLDFFSLITPSVSKMRCFTTLLSGQAGS